MRPKSLASNTQKLERETHAFRTLHPGVALTLSGLCGGRCSSKWVKSPPCPLTKAFFCPRGEIGGLFSDVKS